jgi:hypothetical protein
MIATTIISSIRVKPDWCFIGLSWFVNSGRSPANGRMGSNFKVDPADVPAGGLPLR